MDVLNLVVPVLVTIIVGVISYLLAKTDKAQEEKIAAILETLEVLWKKHDEDVAALVSLQRQIDKEHYVKHELDARFQQLDTTFREGFNGLRAEFKDLARILIDHVTKEDARAP